MKSFALLLLAGLAAVAVAQDKQAPLILRPNLEIPNVEEAAEPVANAREKRGFVASRTAYYGRSAPHHYEGHNSYEGGYHGYPGGYQGYQAYAPHYETPYSYYRSVPQYGHGGNFYNY